MHPLPDLYRHDIAGGGRVAIFRDVEDPQGLVLAVAQEPVAIAVHVPRAQIQHLVQALDDFLYDSRP